jgi:hypothetical protein
VLSGSVAALSPLHCRIALAAQLVFGGLPLPGRLVTGAAEPEVIHDAFVLRIAKRIFGPDIGRI